MGFEMKLTTNIIMKHNPCGICTNGRTGISKLLKHLHQDSANDDEFTLIDVLNFNGIDDAIWCLRCFDYLDYCLFLAYVAESVLHIYENRFNSKAPRKAIEGIRDYKAVKITLKVLKVLSDAAHADAAAAAAAAAYADADYAAYAAYAYAADTAYAGAARTLKKQEIEELFIKHFG